MSGNAFTLREFFGRNGLTASTYSKLKKQGKGAREMRYGAKVMISPEAEADFRREREQPDAADLKTIARLRDRGRKAEAASLERRAAKTEVA